MNYNKLHEKGYSVSSGRLRDITAKVFAIVYFALAIMLLTASVIVLFLIGFIYSIPVFVLCIMLIMMFIRELYLYYFG